MATTVADLAERQRRLQLKELLNKHYKWMDYKWDLVFWVTAVFVVGGAADITKLLFAGDWDFWTDWKDFQWWPVVTAFGTIIIPSALQYIQWAAWRFPTGATYTAVSLFLLSWLGRYTQWHIASAYPMNFVWPMSCVGAAILMDWTLMKTRSFVLTSLIGAPIWAFAVWAFNYVPLAPLLQPTNFMGHILTVSDVQGIVYIRSQTPEYLRLIERGALRSFLGETQYVALVFGATVAIGGYWVGQFIGRYLAVWPIKRYLKSW
ncbi:MAG: methane monooxygenase [Acidobacteria bacterium]|nr:MAG: methane monooxygenase [Acidobacteriota bacterium]